ncbi:MAG TPA: hypothetical protein VM717_11280 [Chthoniobacterales bacterium]|jgi:hypothetical protein|nr:hypothetical protein [Chthoniobacterales bacterium]
MERTPVDDRTGYIGTVEDEVEIVDLVADFRLHGQGDIINCLY